MFTRAKKIVPAWIRSEAAILFVLAYAAYIVLTLFFHTIYGIDTFIRLINHDYFIVRHWHPLFQIILWAYFSITSNTLGLFFLMGAIGAGAITALYQWSVALFDRTTGRIATALIGLNATFLLVSRVPYIESTAILLTLLALIYFEKRAWKISWIFLLLACMTRTEPILVGMVLAMRLWQIYGREKAIPYMLLFLIPSAVGIAIFISITAAPHHAFDPAVHSLVRDIQIDPREIARQVFQYAFDFNIVILGIGAYGAILLFKERPDTRAYILLPLLFLAHGALNGTSMHFYLSRTMLLAFVFSAPYIAHGIIALHTTAPRLRPLIKIYIGAFLLMGAVMGITDIRLADAAAVPWKNAGEHMKALAPQNAHVLVAPLYDPSGLEWSSYRYIGSLYYSGYAVGKNFTVDQEPPGSISLIHRISSGDFQFVMISDRNTEVMEEARTLMQAGSITPILSFPAEFHLYAVKK